VYLKHVESNENSASDSEKKLAVDGDESTDRSRLADAAYDASFRGRT